MCFKIVKSIPFYPFISVDFMYNSPGASQIITCLSSQVMVSCPFDFTHVTELEVHNTSKMFDPKS